MATDDATVRREMAGIGIYGDSSRGSGILNNEMYVGRYIWNRRQSRKKLKSGTREYLLRPAQEWVVARHPEWRIVSDELWNRVKARQRVRIACIGECVRRGLSRHQARWLGTYPKYLFSGLLRCGLCGSSLVVSGPSQAYVCASRTNGGRHACGNALRVPRVRLERQLLKWIGRALATGPPQNDARDSCNASEEDARVRQERQSSVQQQIEALRIEISNLVDAVGQGALISSPALATRLIQAEALLAAQERSVDTVRNPNRSSRSGHLSPGRNSSKGITFYFRKAAAKFDQLCAVSLGEISNSRREKTLTSVFVSVVWEAPLCWFEVRVPHRGSVNPSPLGDGKVGRI